ncbi:MAG TPA: carboxypeptidase-like regulatory domain-containing protein [Chloroflexota bacterium]|jgi:hypothetical protein
MNPHVRHCSFRAVAVGAFAVGLFLPGVASATVQSSTGTLVGSVTCGDDAITPAANAVVSISGLKVETLTDSAGHFTLVDVPAGQMIRIDAASDAQQSTMSSRFNVVVDPAETLDIGSLDLAVCPVPGVTPADTTEREIEERANPND